MALQYIQSEVLHPKQEDLILPDPWMIEWWSD